MDELRVTAAAARRFLVRSLGLNGFQTQPNVAAAIDLLGFVQEDSINICGRIHDLILWPRVAGYAPTDLHRALYEHPRQAFEYYFPNLCALPIADYPHFIRVMRLRAEQPGRWRALTDEELIAAERVLAMIDADGPLRTRAIGSEEGHGSSGWGTRTSIAALVVEKLYLHGQLAVAKRENFERWFDRTERLLPNVAALEPSHEDEERQYLTRKRLRARRLFRPKKDELETLGPDAFVRVVIDDTTYKRPWHVLAEDAEALSLAISEDTVPEKPAVHLLAPLDPLVYDRDRNREIFGFDYTWEVYTPAAKRRWGYYVLPILHGDRLIGRVDPKIDRRTGVLSLISLTLEPGVDAKAVTPALAARLHDFARFLGATSITAETVKPAPLRRAIEKKLRA